MNKLRLIIFFFCMFLISCPLNTLAAEVLQIKDSSTIRIGDQNRTYTVRLSCIKVDPQNEKDAIQWLRNNLPRRSKVNLQPQGYEDGVLIARVISKGSDYDFGNELVSQGIARLDCEK